MYADPNWGDATYSFFVGQPGDTVPLSAAGVQGTVGPGECAQYAYHNELFFEDTKLIVAAVVLQGDVDIYISSSPGANSSNFIKASANVGDDVITFVPATDLYYYVGVCNKLSTLSNYYIRGNTASRQSGIVWLWPIQLDQLIPDAVTADEWSYYAIQLDAPYPSVTISVNARVGDPDVYVVRDGDYLPSKEYSTWNQTDPGTDSLTIFEPGTGTFYIGVYAWYEEGRLDWGGDAVYTMSVTAEGRSNALINGRAVSMDRLREGHWMYYALTVSNVVSNSQLVISLSRRAGNPDLFVSDVDMYPNMADGRYKWSSGDAGDTDNLVITRNSPTIGALQNGTYYIGVYATPGGGTVAYSLTAVLGARLVLNDGVPNTGQLTNGGTFVYETFYPRGVVRCTGTRRLLASPCHYSVTHLLPLASFCCVDNQAFTVTVRETSSLSSQPLFVYIAESDNIIAGNASSYRWSGTLSDRTQQVEVSEAACNYDSEVCKYFIMVYKPPGTDFYSHSYTILVSTGSSAIILTAGNPQPGVVEAAGYSYFRFPLTCLNNNVTLLLTADSGNPDLFVSMGPLPPTRQSAVWRSSNTGLANDVITFSRADTFFRNRSMVGEYYVSVYGASSVSSSFSLLLTYTSVCAANITYNRLQNGQPQWYYIPVGGQSAYFQFTIGPQQWPTGVVFVVSPTDGSDPDLYITKDGSMPSSENQEWQSVSSQGNDDIVYISPTSTDPEPCIPRETSCTYYIAVHAYEWPSAFSITASTNSAVLGLQMDYSRDGYVSAGNWTQYAVQVTDPQQPLVIIVSPTSGNPDLYVEYGQLPTFDSLTSKTFGVDVVTIAEPQTGRWHIGVYGADSTPATFTIVASQRGIDLRNGRPQYDVLNVGERRFYFYEFNEPARGMRPFRLQVDPISFNPQLEVYIRRDFTPNTNNNNGVVMSSRGDALSFNINATNPLWNRTATWRVMVISRSTSAAFSITAVQGTPPVYLSDGRAVDVGEPVPVGEYRYFRLSTPSREYDVDVIVNVQYGRVSLFLSNQEPLPGNDTSSQYYLALPVNATSFTIRVARIYLALGYLYASVYNEGPYDARFSVTMTTGVVVMSAGEAQSASCQSSDRFTNAYVVYLPFNQTYIDDVTLSIIPTTIAAANYSRPFYLYVTTNVSNARAGPTNFDWSFTILSWQTPFTISRNDPKLAACAGRGSCELKIRVGCPSFSQLVEYQFTAQVGAIVTALEDGTGLLTSQQGLMAQQDRYYTLPAPASQPLTVRLEPCSGNALLFVNYIRSGIPTATNNDLSSTNTRAAQSVVVTDPVTAPNNRLTMTVRGASASATDYRLYSMQGVTWEDISPSTNNSNTQIWVTSYTAVADRNIKINFLPARPPQIVQDGRIQKPDGATGYVKYSVFWQKEPLTAVMYTACGLNRTNLAGQWIDTALRGNNVTVTFPVASDVSRYSVQVLAQYVWRTTVAGRSTDVPATDGYLVYNYAVGVAPGSQLPNAPSGNNGYDESSSTGRGPVHPADQNGGQTAPTVDIIIIAFAVGVPVTVLICAALLFLHHKNKLIHENGGIDLAPINSWNNNTEQRGDAHTNGRGRQNERFNQLLEDDSSSAGGYVPPGQQPTQSVPSAAQQYAEYGGYTQTGGGDFGSAGSGGGGVGSDGSDSWHSSSMQGQYGAQSTGESEHMSGRGFYEL